MTWDSAFVRYGFIALMLASGVLFALNVIAGATGNLVFIGFTLGLTAAYAIVGVAFCVTAIWRRDRQPVVSPRMVRPRRRN
jgi:hypothetical protein